MGSVPILDKNSCNSGNSCNNINVPLDINDISTINVLVDITINEISNITINELVDNSTVI